MSLGSVNVGSGDMHSAVYDPVGGKRQVAFEDDLTEKMDKVNPTGSGYMTVGTRAEGSTAGDGSVVLGEDNIASAEISTAFGYHTQATAEGAFAQGAFGKASGRYAVVHGTRVTGQRDPEASGDGAMSNGSSNLASGHSSHAEGYVTEARGTAAHSEGRMTVASGAMAHVEGACTIAAKPVQHVSGLANVEDTGSVTGHYPAPAGNYIEIVGNGVMNTDGDVTKRSNARTLDWDGNERLHGDLYVNCEDDSTGGSKVATETQVNAKYTKPIGGIPKFDLASGVQTSLVPVCAMADNGKFLRVVNGTPAWVSISTMAGGSY